MDQLNALGSIASVIGLIVSFYTLYKVTNLPTALKQRSRDQLLAEAIDKILRIPPTRKTLTDTTLREIETILTTVRLYYVSRAPQKQPNLDALLTNLETEIHGRRNLPAVQHNLHLLRDEITIR